MYSQVSKNLKSEDSLLQEKISHLRIVIYTGSDDQNLIELMSDSEFAKRNIAILVKNNEFVKDRIGINLDSIKLEDFLLVQDYPIVVRKINNRNDSIVIEQNPSSHPVVINGQDYYSFYKVKNKKFE